MFAGCTASAQIQEMHDSKTFMSLFSVLFRCSEALKIQVQDEMVRIAEEMNDDDLHSIFTTELFNEMDKMIEEKKYSLENACLLLIQVKFNFMLNEELDERFVHSYLNKRLEMMIEEENNKTEGKREKLLTDLCECHLFMYGIVDSAGFLFVCIRRILKVASSKEESEEARTEVEMGLVALSSVSHRFFTKDDKFLNEIKEIIQYHQKHRNLTRLAYQSALLFMINQFEKSKRISESFGCELHFAREAARELEDLSKCVNWKRKIDENRKGEEKKEKELLILFRWLHIVNNHFRGYTCRFGGLAGLFSSIVGVFRAAKGNNRAICEQCLRSFNTAVVFIEVEIDDLLNGGAVDVALEVIVQSNDGGFSNSCLEFLKSVYYRLKWRRFTKNEEVERKETKRKLFEKMEEEGYEDCAIGLFYFLQKGLHFDFSLNKKPEDYFIFC